MRDRVAGSRTRSLVALVALLLVVPAPAALAADGSFTMQSATFAGPLGITVAAVGLSGLVFGLWRFLRKAAKARNAETAVIETVIETPVVDAPVAEPVRTS